MAETKIQPEQDHVDRFLASLEGELPGVDMEVEALVDRILGIARRLRRSLDETLSEFGLDWGDWKLLIGLRQGGPPYQRSPGQLAKWTELSSGAMTNRLDRLEEAGIVRRLPDPDDRRGLQIELTPEGMKIYERAMKTQAEKESTATSALTKRELKELNGLLRRMMLDFERREGTKK